MKRQSRRTFTFSEELFSVTLHELRTPISSINGYSSILLTGELGKLNTRQREFVQRVQELCQFATTLIGNLLLLVKSSIQRSHTSKEFVHVNRVAHEVVKSLQGQVSRKKLKFVSRLPEENISLWGDPRDITQIFSNLLSNAVKFTPAEGRVEVDVTRRNGKLNIEVVDTGVGISPKSMSRIFEEFYHEDHPEVGAPQGSGLGLAIVKRTVRSYGGRITVTSRVGRGSRFKVVLPIRSEQHVLQEYLKEVWTQAKAAGQSLGLILCQIRGRDHRAVGGPSPDSLGVLERIVRESLRQEDKIFPLLKRDVLMIFVKVDPKGLPILTQRLERTLRENSELRKMEDEQGIQWRLVSSRASRQGESAARFIQTAYARLKESWKTVQSNGLKGRGGHDKEMTGHLSGRV